MLMPGLGRSAAGALGRMVVTRAPGSWGWAVSSASCRFLRRTAVTVAMARWLLMAILVHWRFTGGWAMPLIVLMTVTDLVQSWRIAARLAACAATSDEGPAAKKLVRSAASVPGRLAACPVAGGVVDAK